MADRQFTCPIPRTAQMPRSMVEATLRLERVALQWRDLAERRHITLLELYRSGRWKHYYTNQEFLAEMHAAFALARRWAVIAPKPEERKPSAAPSLPAMPHRTAGLPPAA